MGETTDEILESMEALYQAGCDLLTITQYLRPSARHHPVERWVPHQEFVDLAKEAERIGFLGVMSGQLVRSSYLSSRLRARAMRILGLELSAELAHLTEDVSARQQAAGLV